MERSQFVRHVQSRLSRWRRKALYETRRQWLGLVASESLFYVITHERSGTHFLINTVLKNAWVRRGRSVRVSGTVRDRGRIEYLRGKGFHSIAEWYGPYDEPATRFSHIDAFNMIWDELGPGASMIKSHCDRALFEARYTRAKVVYVLRDPRDVLTSYFHYLNEIHRHNPNIGDQSCRSFSEFIRRPLSPILKYGYSLHGESSNVVERWASHILGWRGAADTLIVRFRDLKSDYDAQLQRVASFVGLRLRARRSPVSLHEGSGPLRRKGVVGDWRNLFAPADERFVRRTVERMGIAWHEVVSGP